MAAMTNYLENKIIDWLLRGQAYTPPTSVYLGLLTSAPSDSTSGTEISGGNYARVQIASNLTNWSGTQAVASTSVSSGNTGTTSNNVTLTFNTPSADWGTPTHFALYDALSGGNMLFWGALYTAKLIFANDSVVIDPDMLAVQIDD